MDPDLQSVTQEARSIIVVQNTDFVEDPTNLTLSKITATEESTIENYITFENMIIKVLIYSDWNSCLLSWQM